MKEFFGADLFLNTPEAAELYAHVKSLPIIDYHCHLDEKQIQNGKHFENIGELWLGGDHYKWRAMRLCGVEETYITGNASMHDKFIKFATIFPRLCGNPVYYWSQMELSLLFDIHLPLNAENAETIWQEANKKLAEISAREILKKFKVELVATTDDPVSPLSAHGTYGATKVVPTFRPDRFVNLQEEAIGELSAVVGYPILTLTDLKTALTERLDYFVCHGCVIADHGMDFLPSAPPEDAVAARIFESRATASESEKLAFSAYITAFLAEEYAKRDMTMQWHFGTFRNVNTAMFERTGRDAGFDIMRSSVNTDALVAFLNALNAKGALPKSILYSLNPAAVPSLATLSGAFPRVRIGAAWWFNDTVEGIRRQLSTMAEYACLGTGLGMLTDSRSFASYVRFDFFRRLLSAFVGNLVARGEYAMQDAFALVEDICYNNIREFLGLEKTV